jgi:hypothetical protein
MNLAKHPRVSAHKAKCGLVMGWRRISSQKATNAARAANGRELGARDLRSLRGQRAPCCYEAHRSAQPCREPPRAAVRTCRNGRDSPYAGPYHPPTGLSSERPHASTVPSLGRLLFVGGPRSTQSSCSTSNACRSSMHLSRYLNWVDPIGQNSVGRRP